ncbi:HupE/UreJ family protein [Promicromonospora kroppenstedtii]|uniref:HupE/UreJ family protein n=1 Tax=Promicromonospora kroppenstedtii TaxID=440482 RepID=UPI0004AD26A1|nr:HupE/UreJ family protein [Promicromonospora kroppenstedtii]
MRRSLTVAAASTPAALLSFLVLPALAAPAGAHGFTSTVYADASTPEPGVVRTELGLEYDLLVVSAAEYQDDRGFFDEGMAVWETGEEPTALAAHSDTVLGYVTDRFEVTADGAVCTPTQVGGFEISERDGVPYAVLVLDHACSVSEPGTAGGAGEPVDHEVRSTLFGDDEGYVTGTTTILDYELDGATGSAALTQHTPSFSTVEHWNERMGHFFALGAEHLLLGPDHLLFLLALIVGSRRLRDVVLAATSFTLAHSVTFMLAALGVVSAPGLVVEPVIALSIAVVAAWHVWGLRRRGVWGPQGLEGALEPARARLDRARLDRAGLDRAGLDRADWFRLGTVFAFGLVHGLGFAGALGIDEPFSWTLLWSLLVFNVGIEVVQLGIIAVVFPLLVLLRRRAPRVALWTGVVVASGVALVGLFWFVQRLLGLG